jgi:hypothetical protein
MIRDKRRRKLPERGLWRKLAGIEQGRRPLSEKGDIQPRGLAVTGMTAFAYEESFAPLLQSVINESYNSICSL